ncbi:formate/nitrite transporter family protein [Burkholderia ubonensis]|uniref:formate/nitrite transporter family protein n=1 Tax=Burkholderia ubonensis TaxID=101571 RepID=UPI0039F4BB48
MKGLLCNWIVWLAVWIAARTSTKARRPGLIFWPIFAFVASGFAYSVTNIRPFPGAHRFSSRGHQARGRHPQRNLRDARESGHNYFSRRTACRHRGGSSGASRAQPSEGAVQAFWRKLLASFAVRALPPISECR